MLTHPSRPPVTARAIARDLEQAIRSGDPAPGHDLPSERDLAGAYGVSRQTVRAAVARLQEEGWVRRDRLGTFVLRRHRGRTDPGDPDEEFPGSLLCSAATPGCATSGTLREAPLPAEPADDLRCTAGLMALVHDHHIHNPRGELLQATRTYLAPDLPDVVPQLAGLRSAVRVLRTQQWQSGLGEPGTLGALGSLGVGADLAGLYRWALAQGRTLSLVDTLTPSRGHPGTLTVLRRAVDQSGRPLLRSSITVKATQADISLLARRPRAIQGQDASAQGYALTPQDRAWLEAWALSRPADRGLALRARIVLHGAEASTDEVAGALGISPRLVRAWQDRFLAGGLRALQAETGRGRPRHQRASPTGQEEPGAPRWGFSRAERPT